MHFHPTFLSSSLGAIDFGRRRALLFLFFYFILEVSGQGPHAIEYVPANASTQPNDERSLESLIRFSDSDQHPSQDPPPPYDNDSGLNSHRCQQPGYSGLEHFHIMH